MTVKSICARVGMTRQNYYASRKSRHIRTIESSFILDQVNSEREIQPRIGGKKLHYLLSKRLEESAIFIGRDRFFSLLRENNLLVEKKRTTPKTTNSRHYLPVFRNLIKNIPVTAPNQVWVSDLTYIIIEDLI